MFATNPLRIISSVYSPKVEGKTTSLQLQVHLYKKDQMNDLQKYGKKWYLDSFRKYDQSLFMIDCLKSIHEQFR